MSCDGDRRDLWGALSRLTRHQAPRLMKPVVTKTTERLIDKLVDAALEGGSGKKRRSRKAPRRTPVYATRPAKARPGARPTRPKSAPPGLSPPEAIYCEVKWGATHRKRDWSTSEREVFVGKYRALLDYLRTDPDLDGDVDPAHGEPGEDGRRLPKVSSLVAYAAVYDWLRESKVDVAFMAADDDGPVRH